MKIQSATILGSGNVAFHLGKKLLNKGIRIDGVYSPNAAHASALASDLHTAAFLTIPSLKLSSDLYIIAVKDSVIQETAEQLPVVNGLVVHTSGNTDMDVLKRHQRRGVFYPLQTISRNSELDFRKVPLLLEAAASADLEMLRIIASAMGSEAYEVSSEKRKVVHVAAVFANNFTNHLYSIAQEILTSNNLQFEMLKPLIAETANRVMVHNPHEVQTGPAVRGDSSTMNKHLELLKLTPEYARLYELLNQSIIRSHTENK